MAIVVLTSGFVGSFWDEDEPRFAAIAQTMVETGNWTVPLFNGELAVDAYLCIGVWRHAFQFPG